MKLSKKFIRKEILAKTQDYLCNGGLIEEVSLRESGQNTKEPIVRPAFKIDDSSKNKIYLTDVVSTIDARKLKTTKSRLLTKNHSGRHKKIIYDDFGEPLREVWVDSRVISKRGNED